MSEKQESDEADIERMADLKSGQSVWHKGTEFEFIGQTPSGRYYARRLCDDFAIRLPVAEISTVDPYEAKELVMSKDELEAMRNRVNLVADLFEVDATDFHDAGRVFIHGWLSADACRELANAIDGGQLANSTS